MNAALAVMGRELRAYFLSPISYIIAALFLVVHGYSFFLLCEVLSSRQAETGAVMQYFFGGTFLYWLFLMFVVAVLTMRLLAEERQLGTLEPLLTAPVGEGAIIAGKYAAAAAFYVCLWLPTLAYPALLRAYAGDPAALDLGPVVAGYLGTLLCGLSALGVGLLASSLTRSQMLSAVLAFTVLSLLLLAGLLADLYVKGGVARDVLTYTNLFQHMDEFGRGIVDTRRVIYHLALAAFAIFVATRVLKVRPGDRATLVRAVAEGLLCLGLLVGVNVLASRHAARADWTRAGQYRLSPRLRTLLSELPPGPPVHAYVFMYEDGSDKNDLFDDTRELLLRAQAAARGRLEVEFIDVDRDRDRAKLLGERFRIGKDDLREGVIVVESQGRQKFIPRAELADFENETTESGPRQRLSAFRGEEALAGAVLTVVEGRTPQVCFTRGHGEAEYDSLTGAGLSDFTEALRRDNDAVRALDALGEVPQECDVLAVAGPERPFLPGEAAAVARYLDRGGRLLLLIGPQIDRGLTRFLQSGLEDVLRPRGIDLPDGVVLDPEHRVPGSLAWIVEEGYADHPITTGLMHQRTLWTLVRPVRAVPAVPLPDGALWSAQELVTTGEKGFAETDLQALQEDRAAYTEGPDLAGPVPVAAASAVKQGAPEGKRGRLVVLGSAQLATNDGMVLYDRDLLLSAVSWLAETGHRVIIDAKRPASLRLVLSEDQQRRVLWVTLGGMPLMALLLGLGIFWIRRG